MQKSRVLLAVGLALAAPLALAASPVGKWTGKITMKMPPVPANATPQQKAAMQKGMGMFAKMRIMLDLKADKTYSVTVTGLPTNAPGQKAETGTWSQKGNVVTTSSPKQGGKPQTLTLSADGRTMTIDAPGGQGRVVFTK